MELTLVDYYNQKKQSVDHIVDQTFFRLMQGNGEFVDRIMPIRNYAVPEMLMLRFTRSRPVVASVIGEEQEIPRQRNRVSLKQDQLTELKVGIQYIFTAEDYRMREKMLGYLARANAQMLVTEMEKYFWGIPADLVVSVIEKITVLIFKVLTTGSCIFTDPLTGAKVEFLYPDTSAVLLPPALNGTARWNQPTTANALQNLEDHGEAFYERFGYYPKILVMREANFKQIKNQTATKRAWYQTTGNPTDGNTDFTGVFIRDEAVMDLISERLRGAEIIKFDAMYSETQADGVITDKYYLDDNTYFFCEEGNMERAFTPTVERDFQPGIYTNTRVLNDAPRRERSVALGNAIPAVFDGSKLAARNVVGGS